MDKTAPKIQTDNDSFGDNLFPEIQELWDWQSSRIAAIVARPEAQPRRLNLSHATPRRRHVMTAYLLLAVACVVAAVYATTLLDSPYSRLHAAGIIFMAINAAIALHCLYAFAELRRHSPARLHPPFRQRSRNAVTTAFSSLRQMETACIATIIVLLFVANAPVGDGHMMSATDRADRAKTINKIETTLAWI